MRRGAKDGDRSTRNKIARRGALKEGLVSVPEEIELRLKPPTSYRMLSYLGYLTGIIGTAIWGYGDLLLPLAH